MEKCGRDFELQICSHVGIPSDPDERNKVDTEPIKKSVSKFIEETLPGVETEPSIEEVCMYTVSNTNSIGYFYMDVLLCISKV